jgi:hypothetical protein
MENILVTPVFHLVTQAYHVIRRHLGMASVIHIQQCQLLKSRDIVLMLLL